MRSLLTAAFLALLLAACQVVVDDPGVAAPDFDEDREVAEPADGEDLAVPLEILDGPGGGTLAFVPVTIHSEGPFTFALDTGASHSVLDAGIAEQLGLEQTDVDTEITGVVGAADATPVQVEDWQLGDIDLGARPVLTLDLAPEGEIGLQGLLGSDVLSGFGAVVVDYDAGTLTLRPRDASP